jgi:DNA ligase (NAD+)
VKSYGDLYQLSVDRLMKLERMGKKSADNLLAGIEASKTRGLQRLLNALSIRHVGSRVSAVLAEHYGTMEALQKATAEELSHLHEIGEIIAHSVFDFLHSAFGIQAITELQQQGLSMESPKKEAGSGTFAGKTFVVTGTMQRCSRDEMEELIALHGGRAASSVSKSTHYVVAGEKAGSKLDKARTLGITVLTEDEFHSMLSTHPPPDRLF